MLCEIIKNQRAKNTKEMSIEEISVWNKICCIFAIHLKLL